MVEVQTKSTTKKDEKRITLQSFDSMPGAPSGAKDVEQTLEDGVYTTTYTEAPDVSGDSYTISGVMSQEPLGTHPMFKEITLAEWENWKKYEDGDRSWKPMTEGSAPMKKYSEMRAQGIDSYLDGGVSVKIVDEDTGKPSLSGLGKIQSPPSAPSLEGGRNWLLAGVDAQKSGNKSWTVTREYRSSGPKGWDADLYSK